MPVLVASARRLAYITAMNPFDEGVMAAETGMSRDDNHYPPTSAAHSDWNAGYQSAVEAHDATMTDDDE